MQIRYLLLSLITLMGTMQIANAGLITDANDARNWQGATVGTFAALYYGSNTLANRQLVVDNQLLDDSIFDPTGYLAASLLAAGGSGGCVGMSYDTTGTGSFDYGCTGGPGDVATHANGIDNLWFQTSGIVGATVFDLGFQASKAAVFNSIDHGPMPEEAIESTVYLSNDLVTWSQAVVERVWLEGFQSNLGIKWDGFTYAVGTGTTSTFRYASVTHGGPGSLIQDGDNEINGIMGLGDDFQQSVPEPATLVLLGLGLFGLGFSRRKSIH